jgi:hypothetical protein
MKPHLLLLTSVLVIVAALPAASAEPDWANHPVNVWVKQSPRENAAAPRFGWEGSGSWDPIHRKWIHHGGHDGIPQGFHLFTFDLDTGRWEQKFPPTSPAGVCCIDGANVFDPVNRRFVRFPGGSLGHGYQWSRGVKLRNSAVWLYDLASNSWMNMRPAPYSVFNPRDALGSLDAGAAFDPVHELAISFGGQTASGGTNNLFIYDAYANQLTRLQPANPPSPRDGMGICYDVKNDCLVMFGSQYGNDEKTWIYRYESNKWEGHDLTPHPVGKKLGTYSTIPRLGYDSINEVCLCVTWDTNTNRHETWVLDTAKLRWTKMNPAVEPEPSMSRSRNISFDAEKNVFILELTPKESKGNGVQIWTYRYRKAAADPRAGTPANLQAVTAAGKADLRWDPVAGAREYRVYRADGNDPWKLRYEPIATVKKPSHADSGLAPGKTFFYKVAAVGDDGKEGRLSHSVRTQPRVLLRPVVSVLGPDQVEVSWNPHPAPDIAGYHVYRGAVKVRSVKKGTPGAWKDNDPEYPEPVAVEVRDIVEIRRLTDQPIAATTFRDTVELLNKGGGDGEYRYHVHAYIVRAVNRLGTESGPSPYALTIPSEPVNVLNREGAGGIAELKWDANPEKKIAGYRVYKLQGTWEIVRLTDEPIGETRFTHKGGSGATRYWITAVDVLGQEGVPSSPVWHNRSYAGFFPGEWHQ